MTVRLIRFLIVSYWVSVQQNAPCRYPQGRQRQFWKHQCPSGYGSEGWSDRVFRDFFKTLIPYIIVRLVFVDKPEMVNLLVIYTALGVILGHNYPFYMGFKGGKGIAATAGLLVAIDLRVTLVCLIVFAAIVATTRFVSLGSLVVVSIFLALMIFFGQRGDYGLAASYLPEFYAVSAVVTGMAFWRHRTNIVRLVHGNENKIGLKKK